MKGLGANKVLLCKTTAGHLNEAIKLIHRQIFRLQADIKRALIGCHVIVVQGYPELSSQ